MNSSRWMIGSSIDHLDLPLPLPLPLCAAAVAEDALRVGATFKCLTAGLRLPDAFAFPNANVEVIIFHSTTDC